MGTVHMRQVADVIHETFPAHRRPPGLYAVYDRQSQSADKFMKTCAAVRLHSAMAGDRYTIQWLLTPELIKTVTRGFPGRMAAIVAALSRRNFQQLTPRELWYIRRAFITTGVVGFAFSHTTPARLAHSVPNLLEHSSQRTVSHIGVGDLGGRTLHYIASPFSDLEQRTLYRASRTSDTETDLVAVEGGSELELVLGTAADLANEKSYSDRPHARTLSLVGGQT